MAIVTSSPVHQPYIAEQVRDGPDSRKNYVNSEGYFVCGRFGTFRDRDKICFFSLKNKPFVMYYATKRVGAGVLDPKAIRLLRLPA